MSKNDEAIYVDTKHNILIHLEKSVLYLCFANCKKKDYE